jgi:hypothetical protein
VVSLFDTVLQMFQKRLEEAAKTMSNVEIAKALNVSDVAVFYWRRGERLENIRLKSVLGFYERLGGDIREVLEAVMGNEQAAKLLSIFQDDPEILKKFLELMMDPSSPEAQKLRSEISFLHTQKSTK